MEDHSRKSTWKTGDTGRQLYSCHKFDCDFTTFEKLAKCPECGFPLYDAQTFKLFGVVLGLCGLFLTTVGVGLGILPSIRKTSSDSALILIYVLAGVLTLMGLGLITGGIKQTVTGAKSSGFLLIFLVLLFVLGIVVAVARSFL